MTKDKKQFIIEQFIVLLLLFLMFPVAYYGTMNMLLIIFGLLGIYFFTFHILKSKGKWFKYEDFKHKRFSFRWVPPIIMVINLILPETNWRQPAIIISLLSFFCLNMFLTYRFNFKTQTR